MSKIAFIIAFSFLMAFQTMTPPQARTTAYAEPFLISHERQMPDHGGQIESKYDGFNYETVLTLRKMKVTCASTKGNFKDACVSFVAALHCPGIQLDYVKYATIQLIFETKDWDQRHPLNERDLAVVVDGDTLRLGRMELVSQSVDTLMSEVLRVTLPYNSFKKIALGQVVEMQVGKSRFELRANNLAALRDLNNRVKF